MYMQKRRDPRTDPSGTPIFTSMKEDVDDLVDTDKDLPPRYDPNQFSDVFENPASFNFLSNVDGDTLSKVLNITLY